MTSTVPAVLLGTYTRGGRSQSGQDTTPESVFAYTLKSGGGRLVGCTSGAGSIRAGCASDAGRAWLATVATGGAVHTTANTTPAGLTTAIPNTKAKRTRTRRERSGPRIRSRARGPRELTAQPLSSWGYSSGRSSSLGANSQTQRPSSRRRMKRL